ncbi:alpha/beta fold hydrolase [Pseudorhodoferax sp. Leaf267]|uniref:alpha/beta fold hydrolase n=1 Tax=Pseudorhodoferax sp. Leaf267 TaxID=1736316 RepID=UPI0006F5FCA5|nr:alpha/beta hydrolase [Pseudorhodoferax sp. Leaf267]KQP13068.1 alpha/beta hydrolase [Pseudorhodoferax sp. Leaf267]
MTAFADIDWCGRPVRIEYAWLGAEQADAPLLVFLHEGLGSLAMWKDFPAQLCRAAGMRGLVFSRPGYGRSTPRAGDEVWAPDFMHRQAYEVLPALFAQLGVDAPAWLFGHSDGGSIALLYAARFPERVAGLVVLAPHVFVEDVTVANIGKTREAYETGDLRAGLARYHDDPDSAFWGWNRIWLDPAFRSWNIEGELQHIRSPLLAIQGVDDAYGTLAQIRSVQWVVPSSVLLELPQCGHSPHRDQAEQVIAATSAFIHRHDRG